MSNNTSSWPSVRKPIPSQRRIEKQPAQPALVEAPATEAAAPPPVAPAAAAPVITKAAAEAKPMSKIAQKKAARDPNKPYKKDYAVWLDNATIADIMRIRDRMRGKPDRGRILAMAIEDWVDRKLAELKLEPT
ncbi:hypothetical protein [Azospirillum soli]|uniref:hypothetical protein n=1 Tax=Azospirillum soli TaxID=1304799 RepID=UPI001AE8283B|nr:hypothetical protein [Azospirillum soli]MBP2315482.1 pyruvate/2-oxoglutarate dehydrogenase complex dihydrolipoamide acyltransferase (E2) component [Azospirillum soli]